MHNSILALCYAHSNEEVLDVYSTTHKCSNFGLTIHLFYNLWFATVLLKNPNETMTRL